jgi:hypothetical protein
MHISGLTNAVKGILGDAPQVQSTQYLLMHIEKLARKLTAIIFIGFGIYLLRKILLGF